MADGPTYKAQAIERALRTRGHLTRDQTLHNWVAARRAEQHSVQQVAALIWTKTRGELIVSERSLRTWFPDLFGKDAAPPNTPAPAGDPE